MSAAAALCGNEFLLRPMGNICVVGKTEGVVCFEAMCRKADATDQQRRIAELSRVIVESFRDSDFARCMEAAQELSNEFGPGKFSDLYLSLARLYRVEPPGEKFAGQIVLAEK